MGAALSLPRAVGSGVLIEVHGALRVALPAATLVSRAASDGTAALVAVVPATLLLFDLDRPFPVQIDLQVPVITSNRPAAGDVADAFFAFDLHRVAEDRGVALSGTYQGYLVVFEHLSGPHPLTVGET